MAQGIAASALIMYGLRDIRTHTHTQTHTQWCTN